MPKRIVKDPPVPARKATLIKWTESVTAELELHRAHLERTEPMGGKVTLADVVRDAVAEYLRNHRGRVN